MRFLLVLLFIIAYPAVEIAGFIYVGGHVGIIGTLLLLFLVSAAGIALMRSQGFGILARINAASSRGEIPGRDLGHGALILLAGLLLLLPGFLSDILAVLLLLPPVRSLILRHLMQNVVVASRGFSRGGTGPRRETVTIIDLEAEAYGDTTEHQTGQGRPSTGSSPWLQRRDGD